MLAASTPGRNLGGLRPPPGYNSPPPPGGSVRAPAPRAAPPAARPPMWNKLAARAAGRGRRRTNPELKSAGGRLVV